MTSNRKSIRNLSPDFAISPGTQVVLTVDYWPESSQVAKKAGSVGIVVSCPPRNSEPYRVRFADETELMVNFKDLTIRRQEIEQLLAPASAEDLRAHIIYRCQVGSHAFGLAHQDSDDDIRGIYLPPADHHWSMYGLPQQLEFCDGQSDEVYWELEKFLKLALKANPNILETLWTPMVLQTHPVAQQIRESRTAFLSKHIYKTYSGYVLSQFRRMKNAVEKKGQYKPKHAMHLIRLLYSGIAALKTGEIMIDVSKHRTELLEIRTGGYTFEQVRQLALKLDRKFQSEFDATVLPEQPDFKTIDSILIDARRSMV